MIISGLQSHWKANGLYPSVEGRDDAWGPNCFGFYIYEDKDKAWRVGFQKCMERRSTKGLYQRHLRSVAQNTKPWDCKHWEEWLYSSYWRTCPEAAVLKYDGKGDSCALANILQAQNGTYFSSATALMYSLGDFSIARDEIRCGRKRSHWIWFIWPCLQKLRPNVMRPEFLLPDMATAQALLRDDILATRLVEITTDAVEHLQKRVPPAVLFGGEGDAVKFYESMTIFAVAAAESNDIDRTSFFVTALRLLQEDGALHKQTMNVISQESGWEHFSGIAHVIDLHARLRSAD